jgi:hypothetical protein
MSRAAFHAVLLSRNFLLAREDFFSLRKCLCALRARKSLNTEAAEMLRVLCV